MTVPPRVRDGFEQWARQRRQLLTPHWEYPACVKCAACDQPIELTWSSSAVGHDLYDADCYKQHTNEKETS